MKKRFLSILTVITLVLALMPFSSYAATELTLDLITTKKPGDNVTISGTSNIAAITLKVVRPNNTLLMIDVLEDSTFSTTFKLPMDTPTGTYQVVVGVGSEVAKTTFEVENPSGSDSNSNSSSSESSGSATPTPKEDTITINGKEHQAGTKTVTEDNGETTVQITLDSAKVNQIIDSMKGGQNTFQISSSTANANKTKATLTGDVIKKIEENNYNFAVISGNVEYNIPANEMNNLIESLGEELGSLENIEINIEINKLEKTQAEVIFAQGKAKEYEIVFPPVEFNITAKITSEDGKEVTVSKFLTYVSRTVEIPEGMDPAKITTGVVYNPDGTFDHIPTTVFEKNGKWYAKLNSLTNSSYTVIYNPVKVTAVEKHWAKEAVNDMASRLVIQNPESFNPDGEITRGEFAEYITKALGIYRTKVSNTTNFIDVHENDELIPAISIATEYGIISGYPDRTFKPQNKISREEAMVMYARAMDIVKLTEIDSIRIDAYKDKFEISLWAYDSVKKAVSAGVFNGTSNDMINPKETFTYAEAATAIRNLLLKAELIN